MMKNLMALALAFTFVFVGANAASAAPDNPQSHGAWTSNEDCASCHNAEATTKSNVHEIHGDMSFFESCDPCHANEIDVDGDGPGTATAVDCGSCHTSTTRASWTITYMEDNTTSEIESGKDQYTTQDPATGTDLDGNGVVEEEEKVADGKPDGHHLEEDGTQDDCNACHTNTSLANPVAIEEGVFTATFAEIGLADAEGDHGIEPKDTETVTWVSVDEEGNPWAPATASVDPMKIDVGECFLGTTDNGSTLLVNNVDSTLTYTPGEGFYGTESFMLKGSDVTTHNAQYADVSFTSVEPPVDNDNDGLMSDVDPDDNNVDTDGDGIYDGFDKNPTVPDVTEPVDPNYGIDAPAPVDPIEPIEPTEPTEPTDGEETDNPETGGTGIMLSVGAIAAAGAGLVVFRKRQ